MARLVRSNESFKLELPRARTLSDNSRVGAKSICLVFLSETRMVGDRAMNLRWRLGLKHAVAVDSTNTGGGFGFILA